MIAESDITAWSATAPWATPDQIEQDLVLSRLMVEFARHPVLGPELTMRGGTCLHKLWLPRPYRFSEDLDYVRCTSGGVGRLLDAVREVAEHVGFQDVRSRVGVHPKVSLRTTTSTGAPLRVKVEMNTFERSPKRPTTTRRLELAAKVRDEAYLEDLRPLVADWPEGFDAGSAESAVTRILDAIERSFG